MHRSFREQHDVLGDLDGALVGAGHLLQARSKRSLWWSARSVKIACPPGWRQRIPERFIRWVASVLHAASTTQLTNGEVLRLRFRKPHAVTVPLIQLHG